MGLEVAHGVGKGARQGRGEYAWLVLSGSTEALAAEGVDVCTHRQWRTVFPTAAFFEGRPGWKARKSVRTRGDGAEERFSGVMSEVKSAVSETDAGRRNRGGGEVKWATKVNRRSSW